MSRICKSDDHKFLAFTMYSPRYEDKVRARARVRVRVRVRARVRVRVSLHDVLAALRGQG